jgi:hypothetical protein
MKSRKSEYIILWICSPLIVAAAVLASALTILFLFADLLLTKTTNTMKSNLSIVTLLISLALMGEAWAANLTPGQNNPQPQAQFIWTASSDATVDNYNFYWGPASGQYTNVLAVGNVTNFVFKNGVRGFTYYVVVAATGGGLESLPSNEVTYTAKPVPAPPGQLKPAVVLVVQSKSMDPAAEWATLFDAVLPADPANAMFRTSLTLAVSDVAPMAQVRPSRLPRLRTHPALPPAPTAFR